MFIQTELTPNPLTLKFLPGRVVMKEGTAFYKNLSEADNSGLAKNFFAIDGVDGVFFGSDFITITRKDSFDWQILKPLLFKAIEDHYDKGEEIISRDENTNKNDLTEDDSDESDIVKQIKELLDTRVRPSVAMDGGDIIYEGYKDGIVYLQMQGSCAGCPSSTATLKIGIENMLKHYVPEVKEVRSADV